MKVRVTQQGYERLLHTLEQERARLDEATRILQGLTGSSDDYDDSGLEDAKTEKARIEQRIDDLESQLDRVEIIEEHALDSIDLGSLVKLYDVKAQDSFKVQVVSPVEAGVLEGEFPKVSDESPLGKALIGRRPGDSIKVTINEKSTEYRIESID